MLHRVGHLAPNDVDKTYIVTVQGFRALAFLCFLQVFDGFFGLAFELRVDRAEVAFGRGVFWLFCHCLVWFSL